MSFNPIAKTAAELAAAISDNLITTEEVLAVLRNRKTLRKPSKELLNVLLAGTPPAALIETLNNVRSSRREEQQKKRAAYHEKQKARQARPEVKEMSPQQMLDELTSKCTVAEGNSENPSTKRTSP